MSSWDGQSGLGMCKDVDPEIFFPADTNLKAAAPALLICAACPVQSLCLQAHLNERSGIWGGTTPSERAKLRRAAQPIALPIPLPLPQTQPAAQPLRRAA